LLSGSEFHASKQAVVKSLLDSEIDFNNVVVIDTVSYTAVLQGLYPFAMHITCVAHIINMVRESFRAPVKDVNAFARAYVIGPSLFILV